VVSDADPVGEIRERETVVRVPVTGDL